MSTYGSVAITGPASRISRIVQSAEPDDLAARANAAIAALPAGYIVVALALAGAGDGHTFTVTIEAGAPADTTGGFQAAPPVITCFLASEQSALLLSRASAGPAAGTFADTQVAGASKGTRFMGMVVEGELEAGVGAQILRVGWVVAQPQTLPSTQVGEYLPVPGVSLTFPSWLDAGGVNSGILRGQWVSVVGLTDGLAPTVRFRPQVSVDAGVSWHGIRNVATPTCFLESATDQGSTTAITIMHHFAVPIATPASPPRVRIAYTAAAGDVEILASGANLLEAEEVSLSIVFATPATELEP